MTSQQIAAYLARAREQDMFPTLDPWNTSQTTSIGGTSSPLLAFTPTTGGFIYVKEFPTFLMKLYTAGPTEIDGAAEISIGVQRADKSQPDFVPGSIRYRNFASLTEAQQQDDQNKPSLSFHLGAALWIPDGDKLVVWVKSATAVDTTLAGTRFDLPAYVGRL